MPLFFLLLSVALHWPLFTAADLMGSGDWDQSLAFSEVARKSIVDFGQLPLWNSYMCGGMPDLGNPHSHAFSPFFLLHLTFGSIMGMKLSCLLHHWLALWGLWALGRRLGFMPVASFAAALFFGFCNYWTLRAAEGHMTPFTLGYLPWALYFYFGAPRDWRNAVASGFCVALMILEAGISSVPHTAILFLLLTLLGIPLRTGGPKLRHLMLVGLTALLISAVKVLPLVESMTQFGPQRGPKQESLGLKLLWASLMNDSQTYNDIGVHLSRKWHWHEYGAYMGPVFLSLALGAMIRFIWRARLLVAAALFFLVYSMGSWSDYSPYNLIHRLPVFSSMHVPSRSLIIFVLLAALLAGFLVSALEKRISLLRSRWRLFAMIGGGGIMLFGFADQYVVALRALRDMPAIDGALAEQSYVKNRRKLISQGSRADFTLVEKTGNYRTPDRKNSIWRPHYLLIRNDIGVEECYAKLRVSRSARPEFTGHASSWRRSRNYQGMAFVEGGKGEVEVAQWTPNRITLSANLLNPAKVVLNVNFASGWQTNLSLPTHDHHGRVGVLLPAGKHHFDFYFWPRSVTLGLIFTILGLLGALAVYLLPRWRRRRRRHGAASSGKPGE